MKHIESALRSGHGLLTVKRGAGYVSRIVESGTPIESDPRPSIVEALWHLDLRLQQRAALARQIDAAQDRGDWHKVTALLAEHAREHEAARLRIAAAEAADHADHEALVGEEA
jgi:hypothetical protein